MTDVILTIVSILATGAFGLIGWFVNRIYGDLKTQVERYEVFVLQTQTNLSRLDRELGDHRVEVARSYVAKDDMRDLENKIITQLNRIEDKLDNKADK